MRTLKTPRTLHILSVLALALALPACSSAPPQTRAASRAADGEPVFTAAMVGPLTKETPLQVVSLFSYEAGETLISPATELAALIADRRAAGAFGAEAQQTLLLDPAPGSIKARRLLYIALGARADFSLERARQTGATAMREALRLGVEQMAFAPVVRDQGVTRLGADEVAAAFVEGALTEWAAARRAAPQTPAPLREVTYEAGPAFIASVQAAVPRGVAAAHARSAGSTGPGTP